MGYYTLLQANLILSKDAPLELLDKLCSGEIREELYTAKFGEVPYLSSVEETPELSIEHIFGKSKRWDQIFNSFHSLIIMNTRRLKIDAEIKAYDDIYQHLFDWLKPYIISGTFRTQGEDYSGDEGWIDYL